MLDPDIKTGEPRSRDGEGLELTILMPCLNEAETLGTCIEKAKGYLARAHVAGEVLIADNGSTDGSVDIAERLGARVIHVPKRGYGMALRYGIEAARGRFVIMGDADDSYDFTALDDLVSRLRDGFDLVMGNRFRGRIEPGAMPLLHRYFGTPLLNFVGRTFFSVKVGDFFCGLRGFRRDAVQGLNLVSPGMEFALEMVLRARLAGLHMTEVPITLWPDGRSRPPHLKTWTDGWRSLRLFLLFSPRWLFFYPGLTLLLGGLVLSSILVFGPVRITPRFGLDLHALLLSAMATIVGIQSISFAVIARRYAAARGFLPLNPHLEARAGWFKLEQVIVVALVLGVAGVGGIIWGFTRWAAVDFGPVQFGAVTRGLIVSATLAVIALQLTFTAFFAALLDIPSRDQER